MGQTVLVVEDHGATRDVLSTVLRANEYDVVALANGRQALDFLASGRLPDAILLDMLMPVLDGWHFLERLKDLPGGHVPVIVTTGTILTREWAITHGCAGFLKKPVEPAALLAELRRVVPPAA